MRNSTRQDCEAPTTDRNRPNRSLDSIPRRGTYAATPRVGRGRRSHRRSRIVLSRPARRGHSALASFGLASAAGRGCSPFREPRGHNSGRRTSAQTSTFVAFAGRTCHLVVTGVNWPAVEPLDSTWANNWTPGEAPTQGDGSGIHREKTQKWTRQAEASVGGAASRDSKFRYMRKRR